MGNCPKQSGVALGLTLAALTFFVVGCGAADDDGTAIAESEVGDAAGESSQEPTESDDNGDDTSDSTSGDAGAIGSADDRATTQASALAGVSITVGSKSFTEQYVLSEMLVLAFEEAGAEVSSQLGLGSTDEVRQALLSGEIDVYPEYNGTGWTVHLQHEFEELAGADGTVDSTALTEAVRQADLAENDIVWLGQSQFNDTYGFATAPDFLDDGEPFTMQGMAEYLAANPDATVCLESEFLERPDGLVLFEEATGYEIPADQVAVLEIDPIYTETQGGACEFGEVFTTDGRINSLPLTLVEDPGVMIIYNASVTLGSDLYDQAPEAFDQIAADLLALLDQDTMTNLNRLVDVEGQTPAEVAETFMREQGLLD